jgi:hypothetical protein
MNFRQMTHSRFQPIGTGRPDRARAGVAEYGRKMILYGWIVSMIGIVTYCFVMLGGDQGADMMEALAARGAIGWASLAVIGVGVALWFAGCIRLVREADSKDGENGAW